MFKLRDTDIKLMLAAKKSAYLSLIAQNLPDIATDFSTEFEKWNAFFNAINVDQPLNEFPFLIPPEKKTSSYLEIF